MSESNTVILWKEDESRELERGRRLAEEQCGFGLY